MYRAAICDDNQADISYIRSLLEKWENDTGMAMRIEDFPSAEAFLFQYEDDKAYDILFLDIEMGEMSGIDLAKKIRQTNRLIQIVFITGYMDYIAQGYDVEALHYLLKPVTETKLREVLTRAVDKLKHKEKELFLPSKCAASDTPAHDFSTDSGSSMVRIPLYEIRYLEVRKNYVTIHAREEYVTKITLRELEKELDECFFRTGRSFIVNLAFVMRISKSQVFLKDGSIVPLSRNLYENINRAIIRSF